MAAFTVTPNGAYITGPNAVVLQGSSSPAPVASMISANSGRTVLALWLLSAGDWTFFLPAYPAIGGGLSNFAGPVASFIAVLD